MRCSVQNCTNDTKRTTKSHGITFHLFPKEPKLRSSWIEALNLTKWEPKERSTICSEHFRNEDFYQTKNGLRKIKNSAVPVVVHDSAEDLDAPAALRVCRICLSMDTRMYDIRHHKLEQLYEEITGVFFGVEDRLPQRLCWECAHRLSSAAHFRNKALKSHAILAEVLHSTSYITIKDIKSINRTQHKLKSNLMQKIYEPNDHDLFIKNDEIIKSETQEYNDNEIGNNDNEHGNNHNELGNNHNGLGNNDNGLENDNGIGNNDNGFGNNDYESEVKDVEIKNESESNEIFLYDDNLEFESDDDKKLSVFVVNDKPKVKVKVKVKKKKLKVEKKIRKRQEDDDSPSDVLDKYKTNEIKRRKNDGPDENLFTITTLTYEEQISEIEKRQESISYKNAIFKCTICYRGFQIKDRYDAHVIRHSDQCGAYECFICKTRLKTGRALRKHLTAQHTEKFSCKGCPFITRNRGVAREHEKWHSGTKYQCPHCPSEFEKLTTYMGHIRIKHVSDFVCELCGYTFVSAKGIEVHKKKKHRVHDRNVELTGPYCEVCNVKFISEEAHARHLKLSASHSSDNDPERLRNDSQSMRSSHPSRSVRNIERRPIIHVRTQTDIQQGPVTCEQCGIQLRDLRLYAQHFRRAHPDKNRTKYPAMKTPCMCEQCGRIFQSMALLKDHMWVHTGEKRFKCPLCPKSFTQKSNLVFHSRVHSATRPTFECPLCGKHFAFYNNRRRHMFKSNLVFHSRVHSATRPTFECPLCGKHFAFYNNRRRHMFIHTGLKPFKCDTCNKCFTTAGELRAHVDHVHLKKPWPRRARRHNAEGGE